MKNFNRVMVIVMDGCGAGPAPDAQFFGDTGENLGNTLVNIAKTVNLNIPTLRSLGLCNLLPMNIEPVDKPLGTFCRLHELSMGGKDTVTGHWEMMGVITEKPFPTYPDGFPVEIIKKFTAKIGSEILCNKPASGTEIIRRLGEEHIRTKKPIIYTSADSVFQIACHEKTIPLERLYEMCRIARDILVEPHNVQRVIARPFLGSDSADFKRTENRKDFPVIPPKNSLDILTENAIEVDTIGVIGEVFSHRGITNSVRTQSNPDAFSALKASLNGSARFIFANFEDFDMRYGHRNDTAGFAKALETFDGYLCELLDLLRDDDLLIITADHGNDPTTPSTDHCREYVPFILYGKGLNAGANLGDLEGFDWVGGTALSALGIDMPKSVLKLI